MPPMDDDKLREILTALLEEMRNSKVQISDVLAQRSEYAADIRDLKAAIDTTRRSLDPKALGEHVSNNIDDLMGQTVQNFSKGIQLNLDAAQGSINATHDTTKAAQSIKDNADKLRMERDALAAIARHLEERDNRSKWDWVVLGVAMIVAAALAGGGAFYYAKANIEQDSFTQAISRITQDSDAAWCDIARGQIAPANDGSKHCAIHMPNYVEPEEPAAE